MFTGHHLRAFVKGTLLHRTENNNNTFPRALSFSPTKSRHAISLSAPRHLSPIMSNTGLAVHNLTHSLSLLWPIYCDLPNPPKGARIWITCCRLKRLRWRRTPEIDFDHFKRIGADRWANNVNKDRVKTIRGNKSLRRSEAASRWDDQKQQVAETIRGNKSLTMRGGRKCFSSCNVGKCQD